jgi:hypothetical protein
MVRVTASATAASDAREPAGKSRSPAREHRGYGGQGISTATATRLRPRTHHGQADADRAHKAMTTALARSRSGGGGNGAILDVHAPTKHPRWRLTMNRQVDAHREPDHHRGRGRMLIW